MKHLSSSSYYYTIINTNYYPKKKKNKKEEEKKSIKQAAEKRSKTLNLQVSKWHYSFQTHLHWSDKLAGEIMYGFRLRQNLC